MLDETSPPRLPRRNEPKQRGLNRAGLSSPRRRTPPTRAATRLAPRDQRREPAVVVPIGLAALFLVAAALLALAVGRYGVPLGHVVEILASRLAPLPNEANGTEQNVVLLVRMPRILLAALVGGGLALGGAALQAVFRNPLVSPEIIGVSAGASFGGALALLLGLESALLVTGSFAFGLIALATLFLITSGRGGTPMLMVVLGGVVTGSFFSALVALVTYVADPNTTLPAIVFWLLGSVATATFTKVLVAVIPILGGAVVLLALRWRINVLSLGDDDAAALGVRPRPLRWVVLLAVALIVAGAVAVSGAVSWVGLVVPHLARMWVGPDHRVLLPVSFLLGAAYIVLVDTVARTATAGEIPLGVLTALIGAPVFFLLLRRNRERIWESA
ncbi:FecCD family ABC transporter permease [Arthrobacter bambusae]|uniref:FecCD family ABC transporter permease n=1 Tax=Arthrobacter bambusae TaxID=1338426 RepID=UPI002788EB76|nr:iron ABC transporter permease [Arthrobacter bambusae]MDQ0032125.1 iron complex transport system permease protein [Arthrobacter bambusae]MDQ0100269.1 iron complex transport system permease protein [Arthrobacter bambusae]